jgi:FAD/FMN-containing dehydrogenase
MTKLDDFIKIIENEFPEDRLTYQKGIPTFHPETSEEASQLFKLANKNKQKTFVTGFGNNIDPIGEKFGDLISIRTDRLNQFLNVVPEDFYIVVGSGYPLREINLNLKRTELYLPHSALPYVGSVGGALAVGLSGELHGHEVPIKKYFIQAEIVTPQGEIIKPGSTCFKSVSGYDIVKIFSGSWGLLGLITTATFRVMPLIGADDFAPMKQNEITRDGLLFSLENSENSADAGYSKKIKAKFDPENILPVI